MMMIRVHAKSIRLTVMAFVFAALMVTGWTESQAFEGEELLLNSGFEGTADDKPEHWNQLAPAMPVVSETGIEFVYDENRSVKMTDTSNTAAMGLRSDKVAIAAGQIYEAAVHVYAVSGTPAIYLEFWNDAGTRVGVKTYTGVPAAEWKRYFVSEQAPAGATKATILLYGSAVNTGTAYFDNASLTRVLLPNASFEDINNGEAAQWLQFNGNLRVTASTDYVYEGASSVKMADTNGTAGIGLRSAKVPVAAGQIYEASVYAYVLSGTPDIYLEYWDDTNTRIAVKTYSGSAAAAWKRYSVSGKAPLGATKATVLVYGSTTNVGTAYFDNASLKQVLLPNAGFEEVSAGEAIDWQQINPTMRVVSSGDYVFEGAASLKMTDTTGSNSMGVRSGKVPVTTGQAYEASVQVYALSGTPGIQLEFWNDANVLIASKIILTGADPSWKRISIREIVPVNATKASIMLYGSNANVGTAYFDNASLQQISLERMSKIENGGFENVSAGEADEWGQLNPNLRVKTSTEIVYGGGSSLKVNDVHDNDSLGAVSSKVIVTPGQTYEASAYYFNISGTAYMNLEFWDASGKSIVVYQQTSGSRDEWRRLAVQAEAPPNAARASITLYSAMANVGTTYYDNASILPIPQETVRNFPLVITGHPRLYFTATDILGLQAKAADTTSNPFDQSGQEIWQDVEEAADLFRAETELKVTYYAGHQVTYPLPPVQPARMPPPPDYNGSYPYWTALANALQIRLETLSLAYVVTGDPTYANKAKSYALSLAQWNDWKDPNRSCGNSCQETLHFVLGVSAAYDMLYNQLTPAERQQIETALVNKGLHPIYLDTLPKIDHNSYISRASALISGASLLLGKHPDAEKYLTRGTNYLKWYLDERVQSGQNEGMLYTSYSLENAVKAIDHLYRTTGQMDIVQHPFFNDFAVRWNLYAMAPGAAGQANYSDSLMQNYFHNTMHLVNTKLGNGLAGWYLSQAKPTSSWLDRFLYFKPDALITSPDSLPSSTVLHEIGWAALRSGWDKQDTLLMLASNMSTTGHNHYEQNSLSIASNGSWIVRSPGYQEFGSGPVRDFTLKLGHSAIWVDGQGQSALGGGKVEEGLISTAYDYVVGSAADAYMSPKLEKFDRHIVHVKPDYYVILDDLQADTNRQFDWILYNGPLYDFRINGQTASSGQTVNGDSFYVQNGSAQLSAKILNASDLPISIMQYPGAERYGYMAKVSSGSPAPGHRFLTVLKAAPFTTAGYYQESDLTLAQTSGKNSRIIVGNGNHYLHYGSDAVGDYVTFEVNIPEEGDYRFTTAFMIGSSYGQVETSIDGVPAGSPFEGYYSVFLPGIPHEHGIVHLTAGTHTIRYQVSGKHAKSANYTLGIDSVRLTLDDAESPIDPVMQINAQLLQDHNAIGAEVEREGNVADYILFKTGASGYSLGGVESDADQSSVFGVNASGNVSGYAMTRGSVLAYNGVPHLEAQDAFSASLDYDASTLQWSGTVEVGQTMAISMRTSAPATVTVDGTALAPGQYAYHPATGMLTLTLTAGRHTIVAA